MRVLVACEKFGKVRDAFIARGHDAWSCDIGFTRSPGPHIRGDVLDHLCDGWDMMIAFPPCTHLASSGARHFAIKRADGRQKAAIDFFMALANAAIPIVGIENPVGIMSSEWRKPDQIIQPFQFGHPESKATCLWLRGIPLLTPTKLCEPEYWKNADGTDYKDAKGKRYSPTHFLMGRTQTRRLARWRNQTPSGQNKLGPSEQRAAIRGQTYDGIARAMAEQWDSLTPSP